MQEQKVTAKAWYESKTIWFNGLFIALAVAMAVANYFGYADFKPSADVEQIVLVLVMAINLLLRFVTQQPIGK
jgi:quinol-cytochrome oxidoreductase complex cytochrome b subunit